MQYHQVATIFCRPDKRSAIKRLVTHQSLMPGIFRHFLYVFYSPGHHPRDHRNRRRNPVETPSHRRHPETAEIKKPADIICWRVILGYRLHQYSVTHDVCNWLQSVASHCISSASIFKRCVALRQASQDVFSVAAKYLNQNWRIVTSSSCFIERYYWPNIGIIKLLSFSSEFPFYALRSPATTIYPSLAML